MSQEPQIQDNVRKIVLTLLAGYPDEVKEAVMNEFPNSVNHVTGLCKLVKKTVRPASAHNWMVTDIAEILKQHFV